MSMEEVGKVLPWSLESLLFFLIHLDIGHINTSISISSHWRSQEWLPREAVGLEDADIIICSEPMWLCPFVRPRWQCIEWIFVCCLIQRCIETVWKNQRIRRMPFAGEWWFFWSWKQEKLRHAGRAAYGFAEWALWQEIQTHKPLCLHICHCSFQKFGAVLMTQRWGTNSKGKGQAWLFWASLFEGIHSVHRDTNSHWEISSAVTVLVW